jgi:hypothetical protein
MSAVYDQMNGMNKSTKLTSCHEFHTDFIVEVKLHQIDVPPFHIKICPSALCLVD